MDNTWKLNCCFVIIAQSMQGHEYHIKHWPQIITERLKLEENWNLIFKEQPLVKLKLWKWLPWLLLATHQCILDGRAPMHYFPKVSLHEKILTTIFEWLHFLSLCPGGLTQSPMKAVPWYMAHAAVEHKLCHPICSI